MNESERAESGVNAPDTEIEVRRGFFVKLLAGGLGVFLGALPFVTGLLFFLDPLLRKRKADASPDENSRRDADGFVRLDVSVDALPKNGVPQAVKVYDDKVDAWNKFLNVEVGTVWLRRTAGGDIIAFNSICPHLGCSVDYRMSHDDFYCPCHTSSFDLDGNKTNRIPPRGMDRLETKVKSETGTVIWLKYQNFRAGTEDKIVVS